MNGKLPNISVLGLAALVLVASRAGSPLCTAEPEPGPAPEAQQSPLWSSTNDVMQFTDGSLLHGSLRTMNVREGVAWQSPEANGLIQFAPAHLAWIRFEKPQPVPEKGRPTCRLRFQNGDEIFGKLTTIDDEKLQFETWFGGPLSCRRNALQSITFLSKGFSILYEGPSSAEGWVQGKSAHIWEYRDGAFVANGAGTLGKDFNLSGSCSFAFDLAWNGQFSLILALYSSVLDRFDYSSSCYMFYLSPGYITLQRVLGGAGAMNLGQAQISEMIRKNKLHMEIRASQEENTLTLLVDGRLVQRWKDATGFLTQPGPGAVFFSQLDGPSVKVSNIKVTHWEGDSALEGMTNLPTKDDVIFLVNRDRVTGHVQHLREGTLAVSVGDTELKIPLARVNQIALAGPLTNALPSGPWELRAFFAGGGTVAFQLKEWSHGRVTGASGNFGVIEFDSQFLRQLQFNAARGGAIPEEAENPDHEVWDIE